MQGLVVPVEFHGDQVPSIRDESGVIYALITPICRNIGLQPGWQRAKLKRSQLFQRHVKDMDIHILAGSDAMALELDYVPAWLANISLEKVNRETQPKLLLYQEECARVLREYWLGSGVVVNPRTINLPDLDAREYAARYLESAVRIDVQFGYPRHLTLQESVKAIRADTGLDLTAKLNSSPYCEDIQEREFYLEPEDMSKRFHLPRGLMNTWLMEQGYQIKQGNGSYTMTSKAESQGLGKPHAYSRNNHEGYNVKWQVRFIEEHLKSIKRFGEILA
jgi:hypothetical protein